MTRKQDAINKMHEAIEQLYKYRGIYYNEYVYVYIPKNITIKEINERTQSYINELSKPLQPATEKQINYIASLAKVFEETKDKFVSAKLNKFQASELIKIYKEMNSLLYDNSGYAMSKETWEEFDRDIDYILSHTTM